MLLLLTFFSAQREERIKILREGRLNLSTTHFTSKPIQLALTSDREPASLLPGSQHLKKHLRPEVVTTQWGVLSSPIQSEPMSTYRDVNTLTLEVLF